MTFEKEGRKSVRYTSAAARAHGGGQVSAFSCARVEQKQRPVRSHCPGGQPSLDLPLQIARMMKVTSFLSDVLSPARLAACPLDPHTSKVRGRGCKTLTLLPLLF